MEEVLVQHNSSQSQVAAGDKARDVVLNIKALMRTSEKCSGREKMTKALSRKGSCRTERAYSDEPDSVTSSQMDQLRQPLVPAKALAAAPTSASIPTITDIGDRRNIRRLNFLTSIHPKKILLLFASMSSMGAMILIYFTLAINQTNEAQQYYDGS